MQVAGCRVNVVQVARVNIMQVAGLVWCAVLLGLSFSWFAVLSSLVFYLFQSVLRALVRVLFAARRP